MRRRRTLVAVVGVALTTAFAVVPTSARHGRAATTAAEREPVEHVVVIVEQNHTFDSYFSTRPGVLGARQHGRNPSLPADDIGSLRGRPWDNDRARPVDTAPGEEPLSNGEAAALAAFSMGHMDGFVTAQQRRGFDPQLALDFHTRSTAPGLWQIADEFVLFDRWHSSAMGGSLTNMLHLVAGTDHGVTDGVKSTLQAISADGAVPTIFDQLEAAGVSWRYYVGRLDAIEGDAVLDDRYFTPDLTTPSALYWAPILAMKRFWRAPMRDRIRDQDAFFRDAATGDLPQVTFLLPLPTDHPLGHETAADRRLASAVNALVRSPAWPTTTAFVVWDDWGGFYDHIPPPVASDGERLGFRVPALLLSPYAKRGHVSHRLHDHTSVPAYIAEQFDLDPLSPRQEAAAGFDDAFGGSTPRRPVIRLGDLPAPPVGSEAQNAVVRIAYPVGLGAAAIGGLWWLGLRPRRVRRIAAARQDEQRAAVSGARGVHPEPAQG